MILETYCKLFLAKTVKYELSDNAYFSKQVLNRKSQLDNKCDDVAHQDE